MDEESKDRRVRRTRRLLREALLALILEKGYDVVTVQDILDRADMGRATFYSHYRDKDDLLVSGFEELREFFKQHLAGLPPARSGQSRGGLELAYALFEHGRQHRRVYRALAGKRGGGIVQRYLHEDLSALLRGHFDEVASRGLIRPAVPVEVLVEYVVSALLGLFSLWLDDDLPYSAEQMGQMFGRLTDPIVAAALDTRP